jgi:hypothetical protein
MFSEHAVQLADRFTKRGQTGVQVDLANDS